MTLTTLANGTPIDAAVLNANFAALSSTDGISYLTSLTGGVLRGASAKVGDITSIKDFGAVGDGTTDDTAAFTKAEAASETTVYVPDGTYSTTLNASQLLKTYFGPGTILQSGGAKLPNYFTYTNAAPATSSNPGNVTNAFGGVSKSPLRYQSYVVGAATAGTPTTGYVTAYDLSQLQLNMYVTAGHNQSTSDTPGRTMIGQQYNYTVMAGQGDASGLLFGGYVSNSNDSRFTGTISGTTLTISGLAGAALAVGKYVYGQGVTAGTQITGGSGTSWTVNNSQTIGPISMNANITSSWLADPALTALAGEYDATSNGVNVVSAELTTRDNGYYATMSGYGSHIYRSVLPSPNPKAFVCVNFSATSNDSQPVDAFYYGHGKSKIGLDFSTADFSSNSGAAFTFAANQYSYYNCTNASVAGTPEGTVLGNIYSGYQSASSAYVIVNVNTALRVNSYGVVISNAPLFTSGQVNAIRVVTASGGVTVTSSDQVVVINKTVGAATAVTLPTAPNTGTIFTIKDGKGDAAANNITISGAVNIDGSASYAINTNYGKVSVVYNGTIWNVIG